MLKITLQPPIYRNKKYEVFIDRGFKKTFTNKREAADFITQVEKQLNEALLFVNEYFNIIHAFYRTYFIADRDYEFKYKTESCFAAITEKLNYISSRTEGTNYNTFIVRALTISFDSLMEACELIDKKSRSRYDMLTRRRIALYKKLAGLYERSLEFDKLEIFNEFSLRIQSA